MNLRLSSTELLIAVLAVWRGTHLLWGEDGPFEILLRLRKLAGQGVLGELLDCFYCLSLWIAVPFAWVMGNNWPQRLVLCLSLSGGAILLERATVARTRDRRCRVVRKAPRRLPLFEKSNRVKLMGWKHRP